MPDNKIIYVQNGISESPWADGLSETHGLSLYSRLINLRPSSPYLFAEG
jgi:hypothetical protein